MALKGTSLGLGAPAPTACRTRRARICPTIAGTPVLDWQPHPDIAFYMVYVSRDRNFQNMVYGSYSDSTTLPTTVNTRWTKTATLPESQAGTAYYWYIRPCKAAGVCAADPLLANHAFEKRSAAITTLPVSETANDITFAWQDYLATNQAAAPHPVTGERSDQEARIYQVQVSDRSASTALHRRRQGRPADLHGVRQALPGGHALLAGARVRRRRPAAALERDPDLPQEVSGARPASRPTGTVPTTEAFRWTAMPFASSYDLEVYKHADTAASSANRVINKRVDAVRPRAADAASCRHGLRLADPSGSTTAAIPARGASGRPTGSTAPPRCWSSRPPGAPSPTADALFTWHAVPGAATYKLRASRGRHRHRPRDRVDRGARLGPYRQDPRPAPGSGGSAALDAGGAVDQVLRRGGPHRQAAPAAVSRPSSPVPAPSASCCTVRARHGTCPTS